MVHMSYLLLQSWLTSSKIYYIDAENAMDPAYAEALGVDIDSLILSQPNTGDHY